MRSQSVFGAQPESLDRKESVQRRVSSLLWALAVPTGLLVLWEGCALIGWTPEYLVAPNVILKTAGHMIASGELWTHLSGSLVRCYSGFFLGALLGAGCGLLAGVSWTLRGLFDPLVSLIYPVPKIIILPILMVWLGLGNSSKIAIITISVFFPVFINAYQGALSVNEQLVWAARTFGASRIRIFMQVITPASLPHIFAGLRISLALSFIQLFSTEMVSANSGIGFLIIEAQIYYRFDIMFVAIATIGLFGFISDRLLLLIQRRQLAYRLPIDR